MTALPPRIPGHPIDELFHQRWSPRAFTAEPIPTETLLGLFEAARWAPSGGNAQPWRFVFARRDTPAFDRLLSVLAPANQAWAVRASALVALVSVAEEQVPGKEAPVTNPSHAFDAGAAWAQLALQAQRWGWSTHAMGGFSRERAAEVLRLPPGHVIQAFVAVGKQGDAAALPEWARERERPSGRKPLEALVLEGSF